MTLNGSTQNMHTSLGNVFSVLQSLLSVGFENALYEGKTHRRLTSMLSTLRIYCYLCEPVLSHVKGFPYILAGSLVWL